MTRYHFFLRRGNRGTTALLSLLTVAAVLATKQPAGAATNVVIWDTGSRFGESIEVENRSRWVAIPSEMFAFEKDPAKAASDPGYYGRQYAFKGDAVVENASLRAVFWSAKGRVALFSKNDSSLREKSGPTEKVLEFGPSQSSSGAIKIS